MVAQSAQPRVANVVRPKRKKKQILAIPQGQAPPPLPVQSVLAHVVAAEVSHPFPMVPLTTPTAQVMVPALAPAGSAGFIPGTHAVAEQVKPPKPGKCWNCSINTHATKDCTIQHYCLVCNNDAHPLSYAEII
jgi:hypothetical protein